MPAASRQVSPDEEIERNTSLQIFYLQAAETLRDISFTVSSLPNVDRAAAERGVHQAEGIRTVLVHLNDPLLLHEEIDHLISVVNDLLVPLQAFLEEPVLPLGANIPKAHTGKRGRPAYDIDMDRAKALHDMGNTWADIAKAMGISRSTLYEHMARAGISTARREFTEIDDDELDDMVAEISLLHPFSGHTVIQGQLESRDIHVPLYRVRLSLRRVDDIGTLVRWCGIIRRRVYRVRGANALWHQDGNEKLRPWGFWVHGAVDGYSRLILYLACCSNKRADTVKELFLRAVADFGWPSRARGDYGTENNGIEKELIAHWGEEHKAYLRGRSLHNIRIERLWRDVRKDTLESYRVIFRRLEKDGLLDMENPIHRLCLFVVFQPRIQASLDRMKEGWNHHKLSTARYKTPVAIFELSREMALTRGYWTGDPGDELDIAEQEDYGVDGEAPIPPADELREDPAGLNDDDNEVEVNKPDELGWVKDLLDGFDYNADDGNWGIDIYVGAVIFLTARLAEGSDPE